MQLLNSMFNALYHSPNPLCPSFSGLHLFLLLLPLFGCVWLARNRTKLTQPKQEKHIRHFLLALMLGQQFLLYSWYYFNSAFNLVDALPLYPCRISSLLCILLLIKWVEPLFDLLFFMGIPGAIMALLIPDTWNLGFPNAMFIQFFMGHIGILLCVFFLAFKHQYLPCRKGLYRAYAFTLVYLSLLIPLNGQLGSNYAYMASKPSVPALAFLPSFPYHIPILVGFMFLLYAVVYVAWSHFNPDACGAYKKRLNQYSNIR